MIRPVEFVTEENINLSISNCGFYVFFDKCSFLLFKQHSGSNDGFSSFLIYFPKDKLAIAYISSGVRYSANDVIISALSINFARPFAIPGFQTITQTTTDLDKYLGSYSSTQIPLKIAINKNNNLLFGQATGQQAFSLEGKGDNKFVFPAAGVTLQFEPAKKLSLYCKQELPIYLLK